MVLKSVLFTIGILAHFIALTMLVVVVISHYVKRLLIILVVFLQDGYKHGVVAANTTASYGTLDLHVKGVHGFVEYKGEVFLDMFTVLDDQAVVREQDLKVGDGTYAFGEGIECIQPRILYLVVRVSF